MKKMPLIFQVMCAVQGELDVLGLISISAEFYLELNYEELKNKV